MPALAFAKWLCHVHSHEHLAGSHNGIRSAQHVEGEGILAEVREDFKGRGPLVAVLLYEAHNGGERGIPGNGLTRNVYYVLRFGELRKQSHLPNFQSNLLRGYQDQTLQNLEGQLNGRFIFLGQRIVTVPCGILEHLVVKDVTANALQIPGYLLEILLTVLVPLEANQRGHLDVRNGLLGCLFVLHHGQKNAHQLLEPIGHEEVLQKLAAGQKETADAECHDAGLHRTGGLNDVADGRCNGRIVHCETLGRLLALGDVSKHPAGAALDQGIRYGLQNGHQRMNHLAFNSLKVGSFLS